MIIIFYEQIIKASLNTAFQFSPKVHDQFSDFNFSPFSLSVIVSIFVKLKDVIQ
jgi:hypothetical protein